MYCDVLNYPEESDGEEPREEFRVLWGEDDEEAEEGLKRAGFRRKYKGKTYERKIKREKERLARDQETIHDFERELWKISRAPSIVERISRLEEQFFMELVIPGFIFLWNKIVGSAWVQRLRTGQAVGRGPETRAEAENIELGEEGADTGERRVLRGRAAEALIAEAGWETLDEELGTDEERELEQAEREETAAETRVTIETEDEEEGRQHRNDIEGNGVNAEATAEDGDDEGDGKEEKDIHMPVDSDIRFGSESFHKFLMKNTSIFERGSILREKEAILKEMKEKPLGFLAKREEIMEFVEL
jgi:hypothetical protein